jgi:tetratricopeptide (TPR) repeat protein
MLPETTPKLPVTEILHLIEEARNAELCRDVDSLRKILQTVWNDNNRLPTFTDYEPAIRAELLRLCGFFLTFYGRSRNLRDYQLQAKDLLTNATEIFQSEGLADKAAESKIILAFCYWNSGEVSECEALLSLVENDFSENKIHPVYLQIKINRMMLLCWCEKFDEAFAIINEISPLMDYCKDSRLKILFNFEAAILFHRKLKYEDAIFYFSESIRLAKDNSNFHLLALTYNNLSLLYRDMKLFNEAHDLSSKSFDILKKLNHIGWIPHILDSKALIYIDENKYREALEVIEEALTYFYEGEDYKGLTAALWTKVRCLIRLERAEDAFLIFADLKNIAAERIGEVAVKKFAKSLTEEIYVLRHLPLADEIAEFKRARVSAALIEANGVVGKAAKILRLKNHQALSDILNKQFPELLGELGFKRRARRTTQKQSKTININSADILQEREISRLILTDKHFSFDFKVPSDRFETFYFDKHFMKSFGIDSGAVVAVIPVTELKAKMVILISNENGFIVGKTEYDGWAGIYYISDEKGNPIPIDEKNIIGEPIGFCLFSEADKKYIQFSRLEK